MAIRRAVREPQVDRNAGKDPEALVLSNLLFVAKIAGEFRNRGVPLDDLLNEGNIGLIQASSRYDPGRGVRFTTYAAWWIRKAMRIALDEQGPTIRVPEYHRRKSARLIADHEASRARHGHKASDPRCATCGSRPPAPRPCTISLDDPGTNGRSGPLIHTIPDHHAVDPVRKMVSQEYLAGLHRALRCLTATEREVIIERFGLAGEKPRTLKHIGLALDLSRERIRQIEVGAKAKLRACLGLE